MMSLSCSILLIFFVIVIGPITNEATSSSGGAGGVPEWPIWDIKDPKVVSLANFALANTVVGGKLHLVAVVEGTYSVFKSGIFERGYNVDLVIVANNNNTARPKKIIASIHYWPRRKEHSMEVKRFEKYTRLLSRPLSWIDNLYDPTVVSATQFAVAEYNKKTKTPLYFINVIKGKRLVVRGQYKGDLYHLIISASDYTKTHPKRCTDKSGGKTTCGGLNRSKS
ncbi:hypothetical protein ABFS83_09G008000 [Erythranthe nasuta]